MFGTGFKSAIVRPVLKKPGLDKDVMKNYWPVSNLPIVSKVLEKVVENRLENHLTSNHLYERGQTAYRACHSTEIALLRVHHDISVALDNNCCAALLTLDLSAAFDVIDHNILQKRLEYSFGISGTVLSWLNSYLRNRTHRVAIDTTLYDEINLQYGVPQVSVLGPTLYCVLSKPIGEICRRRNMSQHCYADDTQVYLVVKPLDSWNNISQRLESCLSDISTRMCGNMLKFNEDKTELIIFAPKYRVTDLSNCHLSIGGNIVSSAECVKNWVFISTKLFQ